MLAIDAVHFGPQRLDVLRILVGVEHVADLLAHAGAGPAQMGLEDLPDVHARRHAQRVQHDVDMRAVLEERHVLDRNDARHDTLVAMAAGHLVARLDLALHGDEDLDHLHDARRQFVAALQLFDLVEEAGFETLLRLFVLLLHGFEFAHRLLVAERDVPPLRARHVLEHLLGDACLRSCGPWARPWRSCPSRNRLRRP